MLKMWFLYKTVNLLDNRVYYGVYATDDIYFGTPDSRDPYCGEGTLVLQDLKKHGRGVFRVEAIQGFATEKEARAALERYRPLGNYSPIRQLTQEHKDKIAATHRNIPKQPHTEETKKWLAEHRKQFKWMYCGEQEKQVLVGTPLPEGWAWGRSKALRAKVSKSMTRTNKSTTTEEELQQE